MTAFHSIFNRLANTFTSNVLANALIVMAHQMEGDLELWSEKSRSLNVLADLAYLSIPERNLERCAEPVRGHLPRWLLIVAFQRLPVVLKKCLIALYALGIRLDLAARIEGDKLATQVVK